MEQLFNVNLAAAFWGTTLALTMFWGGFQSMRYERQKDVPGWVWVAMWAPFLIGAFFSVLAFYG